MRPIFIPADVQEKFNADPNNENLPLTIQKAYLSLNKGPVDVSVVMPAYNEEKNILQTLWSLCENQTQWSVEIIVVDNNSKDSTAEKVKSCGIPCHFEPIQGITQARNSGLALAKGKYILNADADTIYPKGWIEHMVNPLAKNNRYALTYGNFAFIPIGNTGRVTYFFYEFLADFSRWINAIFRDEAMNAYGFCSGFRREEGLSVDGFNHPPGTNEDGYLALKLRNKGYGKLCEVSHANALVWTTDRRIQIDGGLWKASWKRIKRMLPF